MWPIKGGADRDARLASMSLDDWRALAIHLMQAQPSLADGWLAFHIAPTGKGAGS